MLYIESLIFKYGKGWQLTAVALTLLASFLFISFALVIKYSVDISSGATLSPTTVIWVFCGIFLGVRLLMPITYALLEWVIHTYCMQAEKNIRDTLFRRLMCAYAESFDVQNRNEVSGLFDTAMNAANSYIRTLWSESLPVILQTAFIIGSVWFYTGTLIATLFLIVIIIYGFMIIYLTHQRFPLMRNVATAGNQLKTLLYGLSAIYPQTKYYQAEERSALRYQKGVSVLIGKQRAIRNVFFRFGIITAISSVLGSALVLGSAGSHYLSGKISFGSLIMVATFLFQVFLPLNRLGVLWRTLSRARIDFSLFEEKMASLRFYSQNPTVSEQIPQKLAPALHINLKRLGKTKAGIQIFDDLNGNITLPLGEPVFLCGANGAGKTSLLRILSKIDSPDTGTVSYSPSLFPLSGTGASPSWVSVAPQQISLLAGTIASNLKLFLHVYDEEEFEQLASYLDFPFKLDMTVEEGGRNFSGGELQKLNLIMALMRKGSFLILDEPSAGLDNLSVAKMATLLCLKARVRYMLITTHDESLKEFFPGATIIKIKNGELETAYITDEKAG